MELVELFPFSLKPLSQDEKCCILLLHVHSGNNREQDDTREVIHLIMSKKNCYEAETMH